MERSNRAQSPSRFGIPPLEAALSPQGRNIAPVLAESGLEEQNFFSPKRGDRHDPFDDVKATVVHDRSGTKSGSPVSAAKPAHPRIAPTIQAEIAPPMAQAPGVAQATPARSRLDWLSVPGLGLPLHSACLNAGSVALRTAAEYTWATVKGVVRPLAHLVRGLNDHGGEFLCPVRDGDGKVAKPPDPAEHDVEEPCEMLERSAQSATTIASREIVGYGIGGTISAFLTAFERTFQHHFHDSQALLAAEALFQIALQTHFLREPYREGAGMTMETIASDARVASPRARDCAAYLPYVSLHLGALLAWGFTGNSAIALDIYRRNSNRVLVTSQIRDLFNKVILDKAYPKFSIPEDDPRSEAMESRKNKIGVLARAFGLFVSEFLIRSKLQITQAGAPGAPRPYTTGFDDSFGDEFGAELYREMLVLVAGMVATYTVASLGNFMIGPTLMSFRAKGKYKEGGGVPQIVYNIANIREGWRASAKDRHARLYLTGLFSPIGEGVVEASPGHPGVLGSHWGNGWADTAVGIRILSRLPLELRDRVAKVGGKQFEKWDRATRTIVAYEALEKRAQRLERDIERLEDEKGFTPDDKQHVVPLLRDTKHGLERRRDALGAALLQMRPLHTQALQDLDNLGRFPPGTRFSRREQQSLGLLARSRHKLREVEKRLAQTNPRPTTEEEDVLKARATRLRDQMLDARSSLQRGYLRGIERGPDDKAVATGGVRRRNASGPQSPHRLIDSKPRRSTAVRSASQEQYEEAQLLKRSAPAEQEPETAGAGVQEHKQGLLRTPRSVELSPLPVSKGPGSSEPNEKDGIAIAIKNSLGDFPAFPKPFESEGQYTTIQGHRFVAAQYSQGMMKLEAEQLIPEFSPWHSSIASVNEFDNVYLVPADDAAKIAAMVAWPG